MAINSVGNLGGPEGVFKQFSVLAPAATFVFSVEDVVNGAFFVKTFNGDYFSPANGTVNAIPPTQLVIEVQVNAQVVL